MSWQDELRRLDSELAEGRLGHTEHRKRRDELLAEASGGGMASPVASPLRHPRPGDETRPHGYPDARADAWRPTVPDADLAPAWHSTNPASQPPAAPRPTVPLRAPEPEPAPPIPERPAPPPARAARGGAKAQQKPKPFTTDRRTTAPSPADVNPTEFMNIEALPRFGRRPPARPAVTVQQPLPALAPKQPSGPPPAQHHHQERPPKRSPMRKSKGKPTWLFLSVGVLLVLVMIIGGTWWLGDKTDNVAGGPSPSAAPNGAVNNPPTIQPTLEELLPKLPGTPSNDNSTMSVAKGAELNLYSKEAASLFTRKGVKDVVFQGASEGSNGYLILAIPTNSPQVANEITEFLHDSSVNGGLAEEKVGDRAALFGKTPTGQLCGTGYTSGTTVVTAWVSGSLTAEKQSLDDRFGQTLTTLEKVLPRS